MSTPRDQLQAKLDALKSRITSGSVRQGTPEYMTIRDTAVALETRIGEIDQFGDHPGVTTNAEGGRNDASDAAASDAQTSASVAVPGDEPFTDDGPLPLKARVSGGLPLKGAGKIAPAATPVQQAGPDTSATGAMARHAGNSFLGQYGDEIASNVTAGWDQMFRGGQSPPMQYETGEPVGQGGHDVRTQLAADTAQHPTASTAGNIAGPALRNAALLMTPLGRLLQRSHGLVQTGAGVASAAGEAALQASGAAPEGEGAQAAQMAGADTLMDWSTYPLAALGPVAGGARGAIGGTSAQLEEQALERRLIAAGMKPGGLAKLKADKGADFMPWARQFVAEGFHEKPAGSIRQFVRRQTSVRGRPGLELPRMPTSTRYAGDRAAAQAAEAGPRVSAIADEATAQGATTNPRELIDEYQGRVDRLRPGNQDASVRKEMGRWEEHIRGLDDVTGQDVRGPVTVGHDFEQRPIVQEQVTGRVTPRRPLSDTLQSKRSAADEGFNEQLRANGELAQEARIRAALMAEQIRREMPPDMLDEWNRTNKAFEMGRAGEDAARHGQISSEVQNPQQMLRDMQRVNIASDSAPEVAGRSIVQWLLSKLASSHGNDMIARNAMDTAERAASGQASRTANAARSVAPAISAQQAIRRELARRQAAQESEQ